MGRTVSFASQTSISQAALVGERRAGLVYALMSLVCIVGVPLAFWMAVLEVIAPHLGLELSIHARLSAMLVLGGFLTLVWTMLWNGRLSDSQQSAPLPRGSTTSIR